MKGSELVLKLLRCGICSIALYSSRSTREGIRVCVSLMKTKKRSDSCRNASICSTVFPETLALFPHFLDEFLRVIGADGLH